MVKREKLVRMTRGLINLGPSDAAKPLVDQEEWVRAIIGLARFASVVFKIENSTYTGLRM
jgi:hypothetical protein